MEFVTILVNEESETMISEINSDLIRFRKTDNGGVSFSEIDVDVKSHLISGTLEDKMFFVDSFSNSGG